jgi:hypothetical protein
MRPGHHGHRPSAIAMVMVKDSWLVEERTPVANTVLRLATATWRAMTAIIFKQAPDFGARKPASALR